MNDFRFKVVRADGSHYFYTPLIFYPLKEALFNGFYMAHKDNVREVLLYDNDRLLATFNH